MIRHACPHTLASILLLATLGHAAAAEPGKKPPSVDFNRDIRPILSDKCFRCHGPTWSARKGISASTERSGRRRPPASTIVPGKPDESEVYARITADDDDERMPPRRVRQGR